MYLIALMYVSQNILCYPIQIFQERFGDTQRINKASELYAILETRLKAYEILTKGLFELSQSGALKILLQGYEKQGIYNPFQLCNIKLDIDKIISAPIMFQCKSYTLRSWFDEQGLEDPIYRHLGGEDYFQLVQKNREFILFANTAPNPLPYYVKRCVQAPNPKRILKMNVLKNKSKEVFVASGITRAHLSKLVGPSERTCVSSVQKYKKHLTIRWILLEDIYDFDSISKKTSAPVHLIHFNSKELKKSNKGTMSSQFIDRLEPVTLTENELVKMIKAYESPKNILISDTPGMGKTEFMVRFAHKLIEHTKHRLVIFVKIDEFCQSMAKQTVDFTAIWDNLLQIGCKSVFGRRLLTEVTKSFEADTFLLIDRLDEVAAVHQHLCMGILDCIEENRETFKIKRIISSRPHKQAFSRTTHDNQVHTLAPLDLNDQSECLLRFWENELKIVRNLSIENYAKKCLDVLENKLNSNNPVRIAELPLHCRLIAEVYKERVIALTQQQQTSNFENMEMYDFTIAKLYEFYFSTRLKAFNSSKAKHVRKTLSRYAVQSLFPDWLKKLEIYFVYANEEDILNSGILENHNGNLRFELLSNKNKSKNFVPYLLNTI